MGPGPDACLAMQNAPDGLHTQILTITIAALGTGPPVTLARRPPLREPAQVWGSDAPRPSAPPNLKGLGV
jgi:hypothetical protein